MFSASAGAPVAGDHPDLRKAPLHGLRRAVVRGVVEHQDLVLDPRGVGAADGLQAGEQELPAVGVHHAVGQLHQPKSSRMRVQIVDPPAYTPPYDRSLCAALARAGAEVELVTSRFAHGPVPPAEGYRVSESFYRRTAQASPQKRGRRALKLAEHLTDMLRYRRDGGRADVVHYQWLTVPGLDSRLLPAARPRVLTAHGWLREEAWRERPGRGLRRLWDRMDAIVTLSEHGARRLREQAGIPAERVRVIPHGAFDYLTRIPDPQPLPDELAAVDGPVILCFGLIRPYKGVDLLLEAFRSVEGAELWVVGRPLGVSLDAVARARLTGAGPSPLRAPIRLRQRAARLLSPRRPGRPASPRRRAVGRALRGARLREAGGDERRRRFRRSRRARSRTAGARRRSRGARRDAERAARRPRSPRTACRPPPARPPPAPTPGTPSPPRRWRSIGS